MFRNQCEETVKGTGCTVRGVCGKEDDIAAYQDVPVRQSGLRPTTTVQADIARMMKVYIHDPFYAGLLNSHRTTLGGHHGIQTRTTGNSGKAG